MTISLCMAAFAHQKKVCSLNDIQPNSGGAVNLSAVMAKEIELKK